jgi:hypothetical protein
MGNHQAGRAMGVAAEMWWRMREERRLPDPDKTEALEALDLICSGYRGCDAEFEAADPNRPGLIHPVYHHYDQPDGPLGKFIVIAFEATPEQVAAYFSNDAQLIDLWYDGPHKAFDTRYDFC